MPAPIMCPSVTGPSVPLGENGPIECHTTSAGLFVHFASVKRGSCLFQLNVFVILCVKCFLRKLDWIFFGKMLDNDCYEICVK